MIEASSEPLASPNLLATAGYLLGLAKRDGCPIDIETKEGLTRLNILLYYCQGHGVAKGVKTFDDDILSGYQDTDNVHHDYPFVLPINQARRVIPCIKVKDEEMKTFVFDKNAYFSYLSTVICPSDLDKFKSDQVDPTTFSTFETACEFEFLKTILDGKACENIIWFFDTPNHPFEKHLNQLFKR